MDKIEKKIHETFGWWVNPVANAKGNEEPDMIDENNELHQVGSNRKTMANNENYILTGNPAKDFTELLKQDVSDYLTLYINHSKDGEQLLIYSEQDAIELFTDNPDFLYYDYDSRTKKPTLRIKVLKNKIRTYQVYATKIKKF